MTDLPTLMLGPADAPATVVFAHGAGMGMEHEWMQDVAQRLADRGLAVLRFEFPYMAARREGRRPGPDRLPKLQAAFREVLETVRGPFAVAGKSMGGRVATTIADEVSARCCVAFGYPFHPPKQPTKLRTEHLQTLATPTLVLQGERDPFGTPDEVCGYELSEHLRVQWLPDGDHSLKPRKASGFTLEQHLDTACCAAHAFVRESLG